MEAVGRNRIEMGRHSREGGNPVGMHVHVAAFLDPRLRGDDGSGKYMGTIGYEARLP